MQTSPPYETDIISLNRNVAHAYTHGSGASQANVVYTRRTTLASLASLALDFNALTDQFGVANNWTKIKRLLIYNESGTSGEVFTVSGDLLLAFGTQTTESIGPKGTFYRESPVDGYTVTNTTQDSLSILNSGSGENTFYMEAFGVA